MTSMCIINYTIGCGTLRNRSADIVSRKSIATIIIIPLFPCVVLILIRSLLVRSSYTRTSPTLLFALFQPWAGEAYTGMNSNIVSCFD